MKWNYYEDYDGLTDEQVKEMSISELDMHIKTNMEKNAWAVAKQVKLRIDDGNGPAGDYLKCYVTDQEDEQFFFQQTWIATVLFCHCFQKPSVLVNFYFKNLFKFVDLHVEFGELYMEYRKEKMWGWWLVLWLMYKHTYSHPRACSACSKTISWSLKTTRSSLQKMFRNPHNWCCWKL